MKPEEKYLAGSGFWLGNQLNDYSQSSKMVIICEMNQFCRIVNTMDITIDNKIYCDDVGCIIWCKLTIGMFEEIYNCIQFIAL